MSIPADLKIRRNGEIIDRWILRRALTGLLPDDLLRPSSTTLWHGAGVAFLLALSAEDQITDAAFHQERMLPNGWMLEDKEALMYYRIFRQQFGEFQDLSWMGQTKGHMGTDQGAGAGAPG
jgi:asparagine synthase (glutamine-hydrolysing)